MDKDAANLKKWLITIGLDIDVISDEMVKKLIPPQRRDMWRYIIKHVKPEADVILIKNTLLLHKVQKLQKPLLAKVESVEDLNNALKYEELLSEYNKIEKEMVEVKNKNNSMEIYIEEMKLVKEDLNRMNEFIIKNLFLTKQKSEYYYKLILVIKPLSNLCGYFISEENKDLTETDYEKCLKHCLAMAESAEQKGTWDDTINIREELCKLFYSALKDKSEATFIKIIEDHLRMRLNEIANTPLHSGIPEDSNLEDKQIEFKEFFLKNLRKKLELKKVLSESEAEKEQLTLQLNKDTESFKNDIIRRLKVQNLIHNSGQQLKSILNVSEAFESVIKNCMSNTKIFGLSKVNSGNAESGKTLNSIKENITYRTNRLNMNSLDGTGQLHELGRFSGNYGVPETNTIMEKIAENYSNKVTNIDEMNNLMISIQNAANRDVVKSDKAIEESAIKKEAHKLRTLRDIADQIESLDVITQIREQFNDIDNIFRFKNFDEISKRKYVFGCDVADLMAQAKITVAKISGEDSKLAADAKLNKKPGN